MLKKKEPLHLSGELKVDPVTPLTWQDEIKKIREEMEANDLCNQKLLQHLQNQNDETNHNLFLVEQKFDKELVVIRRELSRKYGV